MSMKNIKVTNYLIEHDADVDAKDSYGLAALHLAVNLGKSRDIRIFNKE